MDKNAISSVSIYPPIGIARLGNSSAYFLASETPGVAPTADGKYKDEEGKVKKQAVRFRLYAFDSAGKVLGELTANEAEISWHVVVANVKAAWYQFNNALDLTNAAIPAAYRNEDVTGDDRKQLAILPSAKIISGINVRDDAHDFDDGEFYGKKALLSD